MLLVPPSSPGHGVPLRAAVLSFAPASGGQSRWQEACLWRGASKDRTKLPTLLISQAPHRSSGLPFRLSKPPVSPHLVQLFSQPGQRLPLLTQLPLQDGTHLFLGLLLCLGSGPGIGSHQQSPGSQPGAFPAPPSLQGLALRFQILNHLQGLCAKDEGSCIGEQRLTPSASSKAGCGEWSPRWSWLPIPLPPP